MRELVSAWNFYRIEVPFDGQINSLKTQSDAAIILPKNLHFYVFLHPMMNPWHEVSPGERVPQIVNSIIEIPRGSRAKYELDKESGLLILDRVIYSSVYYPHNYGFIPKSLGEDHDPIDVLVLSQIEVVPMCIVPSKVIGVMRMIDNGEADDKIIAVAEHDMSVNHLEDISELPTHFAKELKSFFEDYKKLEHKTVTVEDFQGKEIALEIINQGFKDYNAKF